ncbi:uncharacterized protein LOC122254577 isoform X2 [Penaeus japonicus]|uniref:uncharacterized protein LOC122254577 isoform X2 n=1 Tax=Penaeus japonicus TaxID=27405 RepID=UPI001C70E1AB|nr:uncharacterized protein LOC122254577 isoform X2 [Penaeus japonicus]
MSGRQWVYPRGGTGVGAPLLALVLTMAALPARAFNMETCDGKPHQVTINTQADAYLGVVVGASRAGEGMFGCGGWRAGGVESFEALRWSLARINQDLGGIGSRIVTDSFVPGVKFGLHVYDSCEHGERAAAGVGEVFPVVREGPSSCSPLSNDTLLALGVLDLTGVTSTHQSLSRLLQKYHVPVVEAPAHTFIPEKERGQALLEFLAELKWDSSALLVLDEDYSIEVAKVVTEGAANFNVCISNVVRVPMLPPYPEDTDQHGAQSNTQYRDLVRTAASGGRVSGVIVVASGLPLTQILAAIRAETAASRRVYWVLSDLPDVEVDLVRHAARIARGVWVVGHSPHALESFEDHWRLLQDVKITPTPENEWVLGYFQQSKRCQLPGLPKSVPEPLDADKEADEPPKELPPCLSFRMRDDDLDVLARTRAVVPAIHGLFTFFTAMKNAWKLKCRNRRGACQELQDLEREELQADFLSPLRFLHQGPGSRSHAGLKGGKKRTDQPGKLSGTSIGLYRVLAIPGNSTVTVHQTLVMDNSTLRVTGESYIPKTGGCFQGDCNSCLDVPENLMQVTPGQPVNTTTIVPKVEAEDHVLLPSSDHVVIAALFPVHQPSPDGSDCGDTINEEILQEVEAFLWAVDQINQHQKLLPSTTLGALVLDTCGSRIRTMNQVTSLVKGTLPGIDVNINNIQMFVTSLDPETARVTGEILSSLNVTSVNMGPSQAHSPYALQMSPPINKEAEAMVQMLRFLGWDYVSLVVSSEDPENMAGAEAFRTVARASRVCLALDLKMVPLEAEGSATLANQIVEQLTEKAVVGARGVVLFLTLEDTKALLQAVQKAVSLHRLHKHQIVFLGTTTWGDHKDQLREVDAEIGGVLALKDGQQDVRDFIAHYRLLDPEKNTRNPWFKQYWEQEFGCVGIACLLEGKPTPVVPYASVPSTPRVIQAVFSFGAALTQLLGHLCPHAGGKICPGLPKWRQRTVLNEFLRNTEVSRVDKPSEYFQFTENFHGNAPLEVFNLRRAPPSSVQKYKYEKVGRYVDGSLTLGNAMAEFHNGTVTVMERLTSSCTSNCASCHSPEADHVFIESPDQLYILATFNVHERGDKPLECGPLRGDRGIQSVEALLWSLERVNSDPDILPGMKLGAIVLDACSSKEKAVRDVTNFLTGNIPDRMREKVPSASNIVGMIAGGIGEEVRQVIDVTQPYGITTVATQATSTAFSNTRRFPALLRLAPPNDVTGSAIASLLLYWRWEVFSVVYSDGGAPGDVQKHLLRETAAHNLKAAMTEPIPLKVDQVEYMLGVWSRLAEAAQQGARAVVLLLEPHHAALFLRAAAGLLEEGLLRPGDFVFLMEDSPLPYIKHETEALGMIVLQPISGSVPAFSNYFRTLSLANHTAYPWFHEFWAEIYRCRGAGCFTGAARDLSGHRFQQAEDVVSTANAVNLLAKGLDRWRREACPDKENGTCSELIADDHYRNKMFQSTRSITQRGVDGRAVAFTVDGHNRAAMIQVLNFRRVSGRRGAGLLRVGMYNEEDGLALNGTLVVTYDAQGNERSMSEVKSQCIDLEACGGVVAVAKPAKKRTHHLQMYPQQRFGISGLVPYHHQGQTFFSCGEFFSEGIFQNVAAVAYALSQINRNEVGVGLGAILFDYCDRIERARERFYSFFSGEALESDDSIVLTPNRIVASITFDDDAAEAVSNILSSNYIPHFSSPIGGRKLADRDDQTILTSVPSRTAELRTFLSILKAYKWSFINVIYDSDEDGKFMMETFREMATNQDVCIGDSLGVPQRVSEEYARELIETLAVAWKPRIVVLLMDASDNIRTILKVANKLDESERFTFLAGDAWGNKPSVTKGLDRVSAGALTFTMETYDLPDFRIFVANLTLENHEPFPDEWFEEYFQNKFQCRLSPSERVQRQYVKECLGTESIHPDDIVQDPYVFHTILSINAIAHGLDAYITKHCAEAESIDDCNVVQAELLLEILHQSELSLNNTADSNSYDQDGAYGYHIWNYRKLGKEYGYINVGKWENSNLRLEKPSIEFKIGTFAPDSYCTEGICLEVCSSQSTKYAAMALPKPLPIDSNFRNVYGIMTSAMSLLGIIVILVTMVYFMMSYPTAAGTSVLGYMILIGCLMLYSVNFAFIFQPTVGTCAVRRFMMGLAYAIIFSAMLVKVIHTWRVMTYSSTRDEPDGLSRPCGLMLVAIGLSFVQVVLGSAWLILYPPGTDLDGETWRCTPTERFEVDLVISLVYVMVLIAATILFCFETWHAEENSKETRWILLASLFTTIAWCVWTVVATQAPITFRDPAIVIGNLISATVVILFLYARKMYLYSQLTKDVKDLEMRSHYTAATSLYNASLNAQKMGDPLPRTPGVEINAGMPGRQFVVVGKTVRLHHPKGPVVGRVLGPPRPLVPPPRPIGPPPRHMAPPLRPMLIPPRPMAKGVSANSLLPPGARR